MERNSWGQETYLFSCTPENLLYNKNKEVKYNSEPSYYVIQTKLNSLAAKIGAPSGSIKPHQLRYLSGRKFYSKSKGDLIMTSQLMRHGSTLMTEQYLKRSSKELQDYFK